LRGYAIKMSIDSTEMAISLYQSGILAFENGKYREAVESLERANSLVARNTRFGGEVQIWLATAYEAAGRNQDAVDLCEQLKRHPDIDTSTQAKRLQYIWKAPKLNRPKEWLTEIPDMGAVSSNNDKTKFVTNTSSNTQQKAPQKEYVDLSQVNTEDNRFIWVALIGVAITLSYLVWLNFNA
jgi:lipopolysaccharide biosynthesis regulator YciM